MKGHYSLLEADKYNRLIELILTCLINKKFKWANHCTNLLCRCTGMKLPHLIDNIQNHKSNKCWNELVKISCAITDDACKFNDKSY